MVVRFEGIDHEYIVLEDRINDVLGKLNIKKYSVLNSFKGSQLEGINYKPLFEDFIDYKEKKGAFKVFCAKFVTNEDGTGIVHIAPAFGESDFELGIEKGLIDIDRPLCPIDENGFFTSFLQFELNTIRAFAIRAFEFFAIDININISEGQSTTSLGSTEYFTKILSNI